MEVDLCLMAISKYLIKIPQSLGHFDLCTYVLKINFQCDLWGSLSFQMEVFKSRLSQNELTGGTLCEKANNAFRLSAPI